MHGIPATLYGVPVPRRKIAVLHQTAAAADRARNWLAAALSGLLDRSQMTASARDSITPQVIADFVVLGKRLGTPQRIDLTSIDRRTPVTTFVYRVTFASEVVEYDLGLTDANMADGLSFSPWYDY